MSRENVELVRAAIDAWNGGDLEDFVSHAAEGVEWLEVEGRPEVEGAELRGRDEVQSGFESLLESWQTYRLELEQIRDAGDDRVVAVVREVARGRTSGAEIASRWGYILTIRDRKIARVEAYRDPERAFEAAAASPRRP
jgi:ketosteroid isomerase-like protein